jgi:6,7-dimethyl-8-ribityllumazine synthase
MLKQPEPGAGRQAAGPMAIVASAYNGLYVESMLAAARRELKRAGVRSIRVVHVPGAFEIPVVAARLATLAAPRYSAVLCLGVILRGQTTHAQHIGDAVSATLASTAASTGVPIIHGVYVFENEAQAHARCLDPKHNRGLELARTAVAMESVMASLSRRA